MCPVANLSLGCRVFCKAAHSSTDHASLGGAVTTSQAAFLHAYEAGAALLRQHASLPGAPVPDAALDEATSSGHLFRLCLAQCALAQGPAASSAEAAGMAAASSQPAARDCTAAMRKQRSARHIMSVNVPLP